MAVDLIIAVPAHDEQDTIADCLVALGHAVRSAILSGRVRKAVIAVAAHRCQDATAVLAGSGLAAAAATMPLGTVHTLLRPDSDAATVGQVRSRLIAAAAARFGVDPHGWVFNTDADSVVPPQWIVATLDQADSGSAAAVAGMVAIDGWVGTAQSRLRYRQIIDAGITADGHRHVYGANLAVRWDAYRDVGGFRCVPHGEDTHLVQDLRAAGWLPPSARR